MKKGARANGLAPEVREVTPQVLRQAGGDQQGKIGLPTTKGRDHNDANRPPGM